MARGLKEFIQEIPQRRRLTVELRAATLIERERCRQAIRAWPGLTDDEKNIAIMAIDYDEKINPPTESK